MNTNEAIITIFALTILSVLNLQFYQSSNSSFDTTSENQAILIANGYGQSMIGEITLRHFDEVTKTSDLTSPDSLTATLYFGPDVGESSYTQYDDIDDFNEYTRSDTLHGMGEFQLLVDVSYVSDSDISTSTYSMTFLKRITVNVTNEFMRNRLKLEYVVTY